MRSAPATGVLVLGVHRSGTSAVTRAVNLLGVPTCRADDLGPADANNARGYWESQSLMHFNNGLLGTLDRNWRCPPANLPADLGRLAEQVETGRALVHRCHPTAQWVWKDPRNCALMPFWRQTLDVHVLVIAVLRHPIEVASSLAARWERVPVREGLALWERNLRLLLRDCRGLPVLVTSYDDLIARPWEWAESTSRFLADRGVEIGSEPGAMRGAVDGTLRHHDGTSTAGSHQPEMSFEQKQLWELALQLRGVHDPFVAPELTHETPSTGKLLDRNMRSRPRRAIGAWYRRRRGVNLSPSVG